MTTLQDLLDPQLDRSYKGFPHTSAALRRSEIGAQQWNVLKGDLPLPLAVVKQVSMKHNLGWMQKFAQSQGVDMAPHGKTTMSPQLLKKQLDQGAWGLTFATVAQMRAGITAGAKRLMIANQVITAIDLAGIQDMLREYPGLRIVFLVDSLAQLALIEAWAAAHEGSMAAPFEVLLEIGVMGARTGCRHEAEALALAAAIHASPACRLVGIETYEGGGATGNSEADKAYADSLMQRVCDIALACDRQGFFDNEEVLMTAGGSAIFDLVSGWLKPQLSRPVRGLLRSGCYITHDHGNYKRLVGAVNARLHDSDGLRPAIEVWATVQSCPEPGLAILAVGRRDLSYDLEMPVPIFSLSAAAAAPVAAPADWKITALNDQHAYLHGSGPEHAALQVGDLVALGISHPCTTFDKWRWMPVVDDNYTVCDALVTCF
ncbi:D-serine dehydratase [Polaromonas sp. OV174]|uniref:alanine racemase n=1 Tax=Polaromonas sp. OV174 TaxID=1855300 RepID=UPI0008ECFFA3|nr:alanine racemase [Polaromonas sp. OV174]SFB90714.1 D-serine dehydratase [Polaromonas sp. OV174]